MVNKERVQLLVDRLRSGQETQARQHLEVLNSDGTVRGRCCLGVTCRVAMENGLQLSTAPILGDSLRLTIFISTEDDDDRSTTVLPESVRKWYGFRNENPAIDQGYSAA